MIDSGLNAQILATITLGKIKSRCCYSDSSRMSGALRANHPVRQSNSGPFGRSKQDEQTSH